jgi:predicted aspartyl protease
MKPGEHRRQWLLIGLDGRLTGRLRRTKPVWCAPIARAALIVFAALIASTAAADTVLEPSSASAEDLEEIIVTGREPRYVAPTQRDRIGRIWAPVLINGRGPFKLVLDTGATHSGVTAVVADVLGIPVDVSPPIVLHGVTGSGIVPTIRVETLSVGDLDVNSQILPILADAFGGAQGVLGAEGLAGKRIFIDFQHDRILITYSHGEKPAQGFVAVPFRAVRGALIRIDALVGNVRTTAIIDTGAQTTMANLALREALRREQRSAVGERDQIEGVTLDVKDGVLAPTPRITVGGLVIQNARVTFADMAIFDQWRMHGEPTLIIGMDVLGLFDTLIIDYRRHELQIRRAGVI